MQYINHPGKSRTIETQTEYRTMSFDPDQFLATTTDAALSTEFTPIPEGEYNAVVTKVEARQTASGKSIMDVTWAIDDANVRAVTGMENPTCRQTVWLDITDSGALDISKGKNVSLGRLREALGQNRPGAWAPSMMIGNVARVLISHRLYEGQTFADVKKVSKV